VRLNGIEELRLRQHRITQTQFRVGRALVAQYVAHGQASTGEELHQQRPLGRGFQILDHVRLDTGIADHRQGVAGRAAGRVVVDHYIERFRHGWHLQ
jgi:hypothetical protein